MAEIIQQQDSRRILVQKQKLEDLFQEMKKIAISVWSLKHDLGKADYTYFKGYRSKGYKCSKCGVYFYAYGKYNKKSAIENGDKCGAWRSNLHKLISEGKYSNEA